MTDGDITADIAAITGALRNWSAATITGGQLNKLIRSAAPRLDIRSVVNMPKGPGALGAFVQKHMPDSFDRVGYKGADVLYRIRGRDASALPDSASAQVWRTFVSPRSNKHLVLDRSAPLLVARDGELSIRDGELEIAKAQPAEHDRIRRAFTASLPPEAAEALERSVATDADFDTWITALRKFLPDSIREWGQFRRRQLAELFTSRITGLGLEPALEAAVLDQVRGAERATYANVTSGAAEAVKPQARAGFQPDAGDDLARTRRLAHAAVDLMTLDELRAIRLPLGVLLDADRS